MAGLPTTTFAVFSSDRKDFPVFAEYAASRSCMSILDLIPIVWKRGRTICDIVPAICVIMTQPNNDPEKRFSAEELDRIMAESGGGQTETPSNSPQRNPGQQTARPTSPTANSANPGRSTNESAPATAAVDDPRSKHTSLQCLSLVARHHGIDVSADRLIHDYSLEYDEPSLKRVLRIGKDTGLKVRHTRLTWKQLAKLDQAFPAIIRLINGNYVIAVGMREAEEEGTKVQQIAIFDPLADSPDFIFLPQEQFEKSWNGEVILSKKQSSLLDSKQKFGLRWFVPEVLKQWSCLLYTSPSPRDS